MLISKSAHFYNIADQLTYSVTLKYADSYLQDKSSTQPNPLYCVKTSSYVENSASPLLENYVHVGVKLPFGEDSFDQEVVRFSSGGSSRYTLTFVECAVPVHWTEGRVYSGNELTPESPILAKLSGIESSNQLSIQLIPSEFDILRKRDLYAISQDIESNSNFPNIQCCFGVLEDIFDEDSSSSLEAIIALTYISLKEAGITVFSVDIVQAVSDIPHFSVVSVGAYASNPIDNSDIYYIFDSVTPDLMSRTVFQLQQEAIKAGAPFKFEESTLLVGDDAFQLLCNPSQAVDCSVIVNVGSSASFEALVSCFDADKVLTDLTNQASKAQLDRKPSLFILDEFGYYAAPSPAPKSFIQKAISSSLGLVVDGVAIQNRNLT